MGYGFCRDQTYIISIIDATEKGYESKSCDIATQYEQHYHPAPHVATTFLKRVAAARGGTEAVLSTAYQTVSDGLPGQTKVFLVITRKDGNREFVASFNTNKSVAVEEMWKRGITTYSMKFDPHVPDVTTGWATVLAVFRFGIPV